MRILALEYSTERRSLAVFDTGRLTAARADAVEVRAEGRSTPTCAMVQSALHRAGISREAIDTLAVGLGPGSYAGIRAAIAFALGWQLARPVRLVGVSSVECLAAQLQAAGETGPILVAVDAQRGEFYLAGFDLSAAGWREVEPLRLATRADLDVRLEAGATAVGPDVPPCFPRVRRLFPDAAMLARVAADRPALQPGEALDPIYLRGVNFVKAPPPRSIL